MHQYSDDFAVNNPLRAGMDQRRVRPLAIVVFGATGYAASHDLLPGLFDLSLSGQLPERLSIIGFGRRAWNDDDFRIHVRQAVAMHSRYRPIGVSTWDNFAQRLSYQYGHFGDAAAFQALRRRIERLHEIEGIGARRIYCLPGVAPLLAEIVPQLASAGLASTHPPETWTRVIIDKPVGSNFATSYALNERISQVFAEDQVYRIDNYLGRETVQNLFVLRFGNGIFEPVWNRSYIDNVQITVAEGTGVGERAGYYDKVGCLRDVVQHHMMQLLALTAMESPISFSADHIRARKVDVLAAIPPLINAEIHWNTLRGQYETDGVVQGYRQESGVSPNSTTETYVALKLNIETWRWAGVPFYLRAGKRLAKNVTEIAIQFKRPPYLLFNASLPGEIWPNVLSVRVEPNEGISFRFTAKVPGMEMYLLPANMDFSYGSSFTTAISSAYERLLLDSMLGDRTLFASRAETELAWKLMDSIANGWNEVRAPLAGYSPGTWGPKEAEHLIERDGRTWRRL